MKKLSPLFLHIINAQKYFSILFLLLVTSVNAQVDCDNDTIPPNLITKINISVEKFIGLNLNKIPAFYFDEGYYDNQEIVSEDNCTSKSKLRFAYSPNLDDTLRTLVDLKNISKSDSNFVEIFLFDEKGNFDMKVAYVISSNLSLNYVGIDILNNDDFNLSFSAPLEFTIVDGNNEIVYEEQCDYTNYIDEIEFCLDTIGHPLPYSIDFDYKEDDNYLHGITTLDGVLLNRYLLNQNDFSLCQKISADFNGDKNVSISDYVIMLKLILGLNRDNTYYSFKAYDKELYKWEEYFPRNIEYLPSQDMEFVLINKGSLTNELNNNINCDTVGGIADNFIDIFLSNDTINFEV